MKIGEDIVVRIYVRQRAASSTWSTLRGGRPTIWGHSDFGRRGGKPTVAFDARVICGSNFRRAGSQQPMSIA